MNYSKAIKTIRGTKGLTQKDLALLIGKTSGYLSKIESGDRVPSTDVIEDICKHLDIPYYLFALLATDKADFKKIPANEMQLFATSLLTIVTDSHATKPNA